MTFRREPPTPHQIDLAAKNFSIKYLTSFQNQHDGNIIIVDSSKKWRHFKLNTIFNHNNKDIQRGDNLNSTRHQYIFTIFNVETI